MSHMYAKNIAALSAINKPLAEAVDRAVVEHGLEVITAKSGDPVPRVDGVLFHSSYHPEREGERFAADAGDAGQVVLFGFGFGFHAERLAEQGRDLTIIEPSLAMLKAAFEARDLVRLIEKVALTTPPIFAELTRTTSFFDYKTAIWLDHEPTVRRYERERNSLAEPFIVRTCATRRNYKVTLVGPASGGSVPTANSCATAFSDLGFAVDFIDHTSLAAEYRRLEQLTSNRTHSTQLHNLFSKYLGETVSARVDETQPDFIVALAQAPLPPEILQQLRALNVPLIFWFVENYRAIPYWKMVAPHYDYFFGIQKGEFLDQVIAAGSPYSGYLPQAADPTVHFPAPLSGKDKKNYTAELSFMGAGYPNRKTFFARLLDLPIKIWGTEWDLDTPLGQRVQNRNRRLAPEEYVKIFRGGTINLNLHSSMTAPGVDPMADFVNPRTFELPACDAFQLVDNRDELNEMFDIGPELQTFGTIEELREKISYYGSHPEERAGIAAAGRERVLAEHTFVHRLARMMSIVIPREEERVAHRRQQGGGVNDVDNILGRTKNPALKKLLKPFAGQGTLSIKKMVRNIETGSGALSREERILLMINEVIQQGEV